MRQEVLILRGDHGIDVGLRQFTVGSVVGVGADGVVQGRDWHGISYTFIKLMPLIQIPAARSQQSQQHYQQYRKQRLPEKIEKPVNHRVNSFFVEKYVVSLL